MHTLYTYRIALIILKIRIANSTETPIKHSERGELTLTKQNHTNLPMNSAYRLSTTFETYKKNMN